MRAVRFAALLLVLAGACTRPSPRTPGVEGQAENPADKYISFSGPEPPPDAPAPGEGQQGTTETPNAVVPEHVEPPVIRAGKQMHAAPQREAEATFVAAPGVGLEGKARFDEVPDGVRIEVEVDRAPAGRKGIHVHEKGNCSDIPGKSMGEHFAPRGHRHGLPNDAEHHLGDLGNIDIAADGAGKLEITVPKANLKPGNRMSFLGKALVIHESTDVGTGKSGNSGAPIACAVITSD